MSAAGITSGLATAGGLVGGGMAIGVTTVAAIPVVAAAAGYGVIKGIKYGIDSYKLNDTKFNDYWEIKK